VPIRTTAFRARRASLGLISFAFSIFPFRVLPHDAFAARFLIFSRGQEADMQFSKQPSWMEADSRASESFFDKKEVARMADAPEGSFEKRNTHTQKEAGR
jgi:hypothetical protein